MILITISRVIKIRLGHPLRIFTDIYYLQAYSTAFRRIVFYIAFAWTFTDGLNVNPTNNVHKIKYTTSLDVFSPSETLMKKYLE